MGCQKGTKLTFKVNFRNTFLLKDYVQSATHLKFSEGQIKKYSRTDILDSTIEEGIPEAKTECYAKDTK